MNLTLKQANSIIEAALAKARAMNIKPLAVVVLDDSGNVKAAQREDGASMFRFDVAQGKAWAAVAMGALQPRARQARQGQSQLLHHARRDRAREIPAADRRR